MLEGELDLSDFTELQSLSISFLVDENKIIIKNEEENVSIIKLVNSQEYINQEYPNKEERVQITYIDIKHNGLEGELDMRDFVDLEELICHNNKLKSLNLSNCSKLRVVSCSSNEFTILDFSSNHQLKELYCSGNHFSSLDPNNVRGLIFSNIFLTDIVLPENAPELKILDLRNNNLVERNISFLIPYTNLEEVYLGNEDEEKIKQGFYNRFIGSLECLSGMKKLRIINISNTDVNEVDLNKLPESLEIIDYLTKERPTSKITEIVLELEEYE
jgi:hypothetical protein